MASRRPKPEGFDEKLELLVTLRSEREALTKRIDEALLDLTAESRSPTATIAERLRVTPAAVAHLRAAALKRYGQRSDRPQAA